MKTPYETLKEKMIIHGPYTMVEVTPAEVSVLMSDEINKLMDEVAAARKPEKGLQAMAGGEAHADHLQQVQDQTAGVEPTFEEVVRPVMKWLAENCCPHHKVIVDSTHAELVQGQMGFNTVEFVRD